MLLLVGCTLDCQDSLWFSIINLALPNTMEALLS